MLNQITFSSIISFKVTPKMKQTTGPVNDEISITALKLSSLIFSELEELSTCVLKSKMKNTVWNKKW